MKSRRKGFTLIELMVVVAIIGLLAAFLLPSIVGQSDKAKWNITKGLVAELKAQVGMFKLSHNQLPANLNDLLHRPSYVNAEDWPQDGYISSSDILKDAWGRDFIYQVPGTGGYSFDLGSYGGDGTEGGTGMDKDIWNHEMR